MPIVTLPVATDILCRGGLVAIPTETVYGLAANGLNLHAVNSIFSTKGRPAGHPLILHAIDPRPYAHFDERAEVLAQFWPGPLTMVLRRRAGVPDAVTGGRDTVAVRSPAHPVTISLLAALDFPLAAPSANRFGAVSPTTAQHVLAAFPSVAVLDGGPCAVGVESTIVDLSRPDVSILRPGGIPAEAISLALGLDISPASDTAAPGTLASHYSPRARVKVVDDAAHSAQIYGSAARAILRSEPLDFARRLYADLRDADVPGIEVIFVEPAESVGLGLAINDRLLRASRG